MSYLFLSTPSQHYVPAPPHGYYPPPPGHMHVVAAPQRQDVQRKRPKYTRSKTGCLTCRAKKIKVIFALVTAHRRVLTVIQCDESKPNCMRCAHGQRECTWPDGVPARKKPTLRRDQSHQQLESPLESPILDARPSTAGSSGVSETSTPPTRNHTPPRREPSEASIPPLISRRPTQQQVQLSSIPNEVEGSRRHASHEYPVHNSNSHLLPAMPEMSSQYTSYQQQQHYAPTSQYHHSSTMSREHGSAIRSVEGTSHSGQWNTSSMIPHVDHIDPYFPSGQERAMVGHSSQQVRY
ncbi:hypothetical protein EUX98_g2402 [Antrodiella citrinella]|uniref:Zn(2)-C6 fungal-type domain-containing protein n=1 Tax=Antrodiella citrinella TaxID=2447956 RepID=A0A4S4N0I3_9APHY|nr:hypothetical protein EUX98_g2402 [Antrodiella citrinella]